MLCVPNFVASQKLNPSLTISKELPTIAVKIGIYIVQTNPVRFKDRVLVTCNLTEYPENLRIFRIFGLERERVLDTTSMPGEGQTDKS